MNVLVPITITDAMLHSCSIAEPDTGEQLWVSGATYSQGDVVIRTNTHRKYERVTGGAGTTPPEEAGIAVWLDIGPTNRWSIFDGEVSTQSIGDSPLTYVLRPGFFNGLDFYGLEGEAMTVVVKDAPGGAVIFNWSEPLIEPVPDWYEWLFSLIVGRTKASFSDILPYPDAELTITITGGAKVKGGLVAIGDRRPFIDAEDWGGVLGGASAEPISNSYIKTEFDGTTRIVRRRSATDLRLTIAMPRERADQALALLQEVLDVPCSFTVDSRSGSQGLRAFGLGSGSVSYDSFNTATLTLTVKGLV